MTRRLFTMLGLGSCFVPDPKLNTPENGTDVTRRVDPDVFDGVLYLYGRMSLTGRELYAQTTEKELRALLEAKAAALVDSMMVHAKGHLSSVGRT